VKEVIVGNAKIVKIEKSLDHEGIFLDHYGWLLKSARDLCHGSREEAEDLVQDMYVNFVLSQSTVDTRNPDQLRGYLYRTLKNLFIRKSKRSRDSATNLTISDYDSIEIALSSVDGNELLLVRSRLTEICEYARVRRMTHKAASVLILRFFFGYLPSEIAKVLKSNRAAVDKLTHTARLEVKAYVSEPGTLHFLQKKPEGMTSEKILPVVKKRKANLPDDPVELKAELRGQILSWNDGLCFNKEALSITYTETREQHPSTVELAHLVTCKACLNTANEILGIPSLDMHFSSDNDEPDDKNPPSNSGKDEQMRLRLRRKKRVAFEHRPAQLNIAVNGQVLGTTAINGEFNEFQLSLNSVPHPENIEVFSEQGITLLHFDLLESGSDGVPSQRARVELSDDRAVAVELIWGADGAVVNVSYRDLASQAHEADILDGDTQTLLPQKLDDVESSPRPKNAMNRWRRLTSWLSGVNWAAPLPVALSAGISLLALGIFGHYAYREGQVRPITPATLLKESLQNEEASLPNKGAIHRTIAYEVRQEDGQIVDSGTIDSLRGKSPSRRALRLFDVRGKLIAGHWVNVAGTITDHTFGRKPDLRTGPSEGKTGELWTHLPEADDFVNLTGTNSNLTVTPAVDGYEIKYSSSSYTTEPRVIEASLTLTRGTRRPIKETFRIENHDRVQEYRFEELKYDYVPASQQLESDFAPPGPEPTIGGTNTGGSTGELSNARITLEALMLLSNLGPDVEGTVNVERTPNGGTSIDGVFETTAQKVTVARVFAPLGYDHDLVVDLHAADEPIADRAPRKTIQLESLDTIAVENQHIPFDAVLRSTLAESGVPQPELDDRIRVTATSALDHGSRLHREAWTIQQIAAADFTSSELRTMRPEDRMLWLTLLDKHLREFENERSELARVLGPLFHPETSGSFSYPSEQPAPITSIDELRIATQTLNEYGERLDRLLTADLTLSPSIPPTTNDLDVIAQSMANLRLQESKLHQIVERLQSFR
jgi:RNA polymerase sigma factor (sigma-70 family)